MIQRIQSLWLFLAGIGGLITYKLPLWNCVLNDSTTKAFYVAENLLLFVVIILASIVGFVTIFLFKKRTQQKWLSLLGMLLSAGIFGLEFYLIETFKDTHSFLESSWQIGSVLPILMMILFFLAYLGIAKDDKMVKSVDRIR
jgi:branched-subunit amino acid transport protein AzlD